MKIQTSTFNASWVRPELESGLAGFVKDDSHHIAVTGDVSKSLGLRPAASVKVSPEMTLQAVPIAAKGLTAEQRLAVEKAAITFGSSTLPILKKYIPEVSGAIDGIDVVFATKSAFDAWADPERTSLAKPLIKSARLFSELVDVAQMAVPTLKNVPYLGAVGVFIKVGDSVIQMWADVSKAVKSPAPK